MVLLFFCSLYSLRVVLNIYTDCFCEQACGVLFVVFLKLLEQLRISKHRYLLIFRTTSRLNSIGNFIFRRFVCVACVFWGMENLPTFSGEKIKRALFFPKNQINQKIGRKKKTVPEKKWLCFYFLHVVADTVVLALPVRLRICHPSSNSVVKFDTKLVKGPLARFI